MKAEEIVRVIKEHFKDKIVELKTPKPNRIYLKVIKESLIDIARYIKEELGFDMPISAGGTDYPKQKKIELFWVIWSSKNNVVLVLKTDVDRDKPEIPTLSKVWLGVMKFERETWELLGVKYIGHPKLKPLLLPEDWNYEREGYPLRKDFDLKRYEVRWGGE